jgi:hypothetical protein
MKHSPTFRGMFQETTEKQLKNKRMKLFTTLLSFIVILLHFSCNHFKTASNHAEIESVKKHITKITKTGSYRNYLNLTALNNTAEYLFSEFQKFCDTVQYQDFKVDGNAYKNVIASIGTSKEKRLVIGAHYDVCGRQEGADDNASGIAGLLELARILSKEKLDFRIDFVSYSLEEPPFFGTRQMGSYIHAKSLKNQNVKLMGMICLEMIGFYNDSPDSQKYPLGILKWFYGRKGNYITVVQKFNNGRFGDKVKDYMTRQKMIPTKSFIGPKSLPGIDFSDHANYWTFGYKAVMITNTAFYRNTNYHEPTDTMETLDFTRMCKVIDEVANCVLNL